jgi:VanZ family protein
MKLQIILRATAWLLLVAVVFAILGPENLRPRTSLDVSLERVLPFALAGLLFALAYPRHVILAAAFIIVTTLSLEYLQTLRPDRHGRELDAAMKVIGAIVCLGLGRFLVHLGSRTRSR